MDDFMSTRELLDKLKEEDYDCSLPNLNSYISAEHVTPKKFGSALMWNMSTIIKLKQHLRRLDRGPKKTGV